ncbi:hypothetical protein J4471_00515 [Candidatus Woesearchaeota archaeon]|nr:hypothetical protein [Candidatus Woesearchaeota archaeon]
MGLEDIAFAFVDKVDSNRMESILRDLNNKSEDFSRAFNYLIAVCEKLNSTGLQEKYMLIGGYAVLAHLYSARGDKILSRWRGSHDLDLVSRDYSIESVLEGAFEEVEVNTSHFPDKDVAYIKDELELLRELEGNPSKPPFKIDLYVPKSAGDIVLCREEIDEKIWSRSRDIDILGHNIRAMSIIDLIKLKLNVETKTGLPRDRDIADIYNLLGLAEIEKYMVNDIYAELGSKQKLKLAKVISLYNTIGKPNEEVLVRPSQEYMAGYCKLARA